MTQRTIVRVPDEIANKYRFVVIAGKRCEQLQRGAFPKVEVVVPVNKHGQAQDEEGRTGSSHGRRPEAQQAQGGPQEPGPDEEDAPAGGGGGTLPHFLGQGAKGVLHLTGDLGALEDQDEKKNEIDDQEEHG